MSKNQTDIRRRHSKFTAQQKIFTAAVFTVALSGFIILMNQVKKGATRTFDEVILDNISQNMTPLADSFFIVATQLGGVAFIGLVVIVISLNLIAKMRYRNAIFLVVMTAGAGLLNTGLKFLVGRTRPDLWVQPITETGFSFPSGHAVGSIALAISAVFLLWGTRWRRFALGLGVLYVVMIGYSRIYLGVHYPTDIIGGWLVGVIWALIVAGVFCGVSMYRRNHQTEPNKV